MPMAGLVVTGDAECQSPLLEVFVRLGLGGGFTLLAFFALMGREIPNLVNDGLPFGVPVLDAFEQVRQVGMQHFMVWLVGVSNVIHRTGEKRDGVRAGITGCSGRWVGFMLRKNVLVGYTHSAPSHGTSTLTRGAPIRIDSPDDDQGSPCHR